MRDNNTFDVRLAKHDGKIYELEVIGDITVSRSVNSASSMKLTVVRDKVVVEKGEIIAFRLNGVHDVFYGPIEEMSMDQDGLSLTCYDQLSFMANNTYTQNYGNVTATDLLIRMCDDFGFNQTDPPVCEDTQYVIPNVILQNANLLDTIVDALNITYRNTGNKFYVYDYFNNVCLSNMNDPSTLRVPTCYITPQTCEGYSYKHNLNGVFNKITVETKEENMTDRKRVVLEDKESQKNYGVREYYEQADEGENIDNVAKKLLEDKVFLKYNMSISGQEGDARVVGGSSVYVDFYAERFKVREYIRGWFRVDSVTHKFSLGEHTMDMELTLIEMDTDWTRTEAFG